MLPPFHTYLGNEIHYTNVGCGFQTASSLHMEKWYYIVNVKGFNQTAHLSLKNKEILCQ